MRRLWALLTTSSALLSCAVALVGFVWGWVISGPAWAEGINWDTASYVALYASGQGSPLDLPWNSHYALGPIYALAGAVARACGGTWVDGVRLACASAMAAAAFCFATFAQLRTGPAGVVWGLLYVASWGVSRLALTLEDNVLYLPFACAAVLLALHHADAWSWRLSLIAAVLVAGGALVSWQAGLYLFPALYVAAFVGGKARSWQTRAKEVAITLATFVGTCVIFVLLFRMLSSRNSLATLLHTLFSRPSPSFFPRSLHDLVTLFSDQRVFAQVAAGVCAQVSAGRAACTALSASLGLIIAVLVTAAVIFSLVRARATSRWRGHVAWISFAAIFVATAFYVDLPDDHYKRYEFIPLFVCVAGLLGMERAAKVPLVALRMAVAVSVVLSAWGTLAQARTYRRNLPETTPPGYLGRGDEPWFVYFRRLRHEHPSACLFTLRLDDSLLHGRYQLEIPAALWSELPAHQLVGFPGAMRDWPRKVNVVAPSALPPARACEWRSL